jgi:hypothetical protein
MKGTENFFYYFFIYAKFMKILILFTKEIAEIDEIIILKISQTGLKK